MGAPPSAAAAMIVARSGRSLEVLRTLVVRCRSVREVNRRQTPLHDHQLFAKTLNSNAAKDEPP